MHECRQLSSQPLPHPHSSLLCPVPHSPLMPANLVQREASSPGLPFQYSAIASCSRHQTRPSKHCCTAIRSTQLACTARQAPSVAGRWRWPLPRCMHQPGCKQSCCCHEPWLRLPHTAQAPWHCHTQCRLHGTRQPQAARRLKEPLLEGAYIGALALLKGTYMSAQPAAPRCTPAAGHRHPQHPGKSWHRPCAAGSRN